jgi:peroxiredoxin
LRDDIDRFTAKGAQVVAVAPAGPEGVGTFVRDRPFPFPLLADTDHHVFDAYDVIARMSSLGQRPAVFVIGRDGVVVFDSIGTQQWQIPSDDVVLGAIPSTA